MARASIAARLTKLERVAVPKLHTTVAYFDPETDLIAGPMPTAKRIILAPRWASDTAWEAAAIAQQTQLINSAA